jgi:cyclopropane-fatty-acyl-phospholipid synthase
MSDQSLTTERLASATDWHEHTATEPPPATPHPAPQAPPPPSPRHLAHARALLQELFGPIDARGFAVRWWDGSIDQPATGAVPFTLVLARAGALRRMLLPPSEVSITEAYIHGAVDVEGDLEAASMLGDRIAERMHSPSRLARVVGHLLRLPRDGGDDVVERRVHGLLHDGRPHTPKRDAHAVRFHYDLGNDFYALWLDRNMVYSCAYFERADESLDDAQANKLEHICRKLRLRPGQRLLDIGCGWGALIIHAARHHGVRALGITLSTEQAREATARIARAGLADSCRVELRDYRTLGERDDDRFDHISSVGMVEHVGAARLDAYFAAVHRVLEPGGLFLNHGIVSLEDARPRSLRSRIEGWAWRRDRFINRYVFPDGRLVPLALMLASAERAGFETRDAESLREHYALTLRHWVNRLEQCHDAAVALVGEATWRVWRLYMSAAARGFATARIGVVQTLLARPDASGASGVPWTRRDMYTP